MEIIRDGLWLCIDCTIVSCNGDVSGIEGDEQIAKVEAGLAGLGPHLVPDFDSETDDGCRDFAACQCDSCGTRLAGVRRRFAVLG